MDYLEAVSVPVIAVIVYTTMALIKYAVKSNEIFMRLIPLLSGVTGAVLGVICFYFVPQIISAENVLIAVISGAASGLCATGCNQIFKQTLKNIKIGTDFGGLSVKPGEDEKSVSEDCEEQKPDKVASNVESSEKDE